MTQDKRPPFLHAKVTAELPFQLGLDAKPMPRFLNVLGRPDEHGRMPAVFWFIRNRSWALCYAADSDWPTILQQPSRFATVSSKGDFGSLSKWLAEEELRNAVILPTGTLMELWLGFKDADFPKDVVAYGKAEKTKSLVVFLINEILSRYQAACGFVPAAGHVRPVSLLELRHLSVQLFRGDVAASPSYGILPAFPGELPQWPFEQPIDAETRFDVLLGGPPVPLWIQLAHDAHALLFCSRHEQSIVGWVQALEVGVDQVAKHLGIALSKKGTVEEHLDEIVKHCGTGPMNDHLRTKLVDARRRRNKIVHEGARLGIDGGAEASAVADAATDALALLEGALHVKPLAHVK